jgi:hypothetical protein
VVRFRNVATGPQQIARFARLPQRSKDVWQGGVIRMPMWIDGPDGNPYRPFGAVWVSLETGLVNVKIAEPSDGDVELAVAALVELGLKFAQTRPTTIQVTDRMFGEQVAHALADSELPIAIVPRLEVVKALVERMAAQQEGDVAPGALDARGMTVERMRAFASAARDFYIAAPWRHLSDEDLVHVEESRIGRPFRYLTVLGGAGHSFGLGFHKSPKAFEDLLRSSDPETLLGSDGAWSVTFDVPSRIPISDHDLWEEHGLPLAGPAAYPIIARYDRSGEIRRPDAHELADIEAILLTLSRTTESEIDRGRWTHEVTTHDGPRTITLAVPDLLAPIDEPTQLSLDDRLGSGAPTLDTPLDRAQDLAWAAMDMRGRRRLQLARKALEISADCADAYVILAQHCDDLERACELYAQGVAAGERALGPAPFEQPNWPFWADLRSRPYMRARLCLAQCLEDLGQPDEAIAHYREMLRLNPGDNQGVRYSLVAALLLANRNDDVEPLLQQYADPSALWQYSLVLWTFRSEGDSKVSRAQLRAALRSNRYVPAYLTGAREWEGSTPELYTMGSREEAVICDEELGEAWYSTPGAVEWLASHAPPETRRKHRRR